MHAYVRLDILIIKKSGKKKTRGSIKYSTNSNSTKYQRKTKNNLNTQ